MDICVNHLFNRQKKKNLLNETFYKLENIEQKEYLCYNINSYGNVIVACSKSYLYFFNLLTGTLLYEFFYNEESVQEKEKPQESITDNEQLKEENNKEHEEGGSQELLHKQSLDYNLEGLEEVTGDELHIQEEEKLSLEENYNIEETAQLSKSGNYSKKGSTNKKGKKKGKFSNKRSSVKFPKDGGPTTKKRKNEIGIGVKKNTEEPDIDESSIYKKVEFIKNDTYIFCVSKRYLHIYDVYKFPIKRIINIDFFYLITGIETFLSDRLYFPSNHIEYVYSFLNASKTNIGVTEEELIASEHVSTDSIDKNVCTNDNHFLIFKKLYELYSSTTLLKNKNLEIIEIKIMNLKKTRRIDKNGKKQKWYCLDLILCPKEQIPYITKIYIAKDREEYYIVDLKQTQPLISNEQMCALFDQYMKERTIYVKKDKGGRVKYKSKKCTSVSNDQILKTKENNYTFEDLQNGSMNKSVSVSNDCFSVDPIEDASLTQQEFQSTQEIEEPKDSYSELLPTTSMFTNTKEFPFINKYYQHFELDKGIAKRLFINCFPICWFQYICKKRIKELPTTLNVYGNLDKVIKEYTDQNINQENQIFKKENGYFLFDYSSKDECNYSVYPKELLQNIAIYKKLKKLKNLDFTKRYLFVGVHAYIYVYELYYYIDKENKSDEDFEFKENEMLPEVLRNDRIYKESIELTKCIYEVHKNYSKIYKDNEWRNNRIHFRFLFNVYLGPVTPVEIVVREKGNMLCVRSLEKVFVFKILYRYEFYNNLSEAYSSFLNNEENKIGSNVVVLNESVIKEEGKQSSTATAIIQNDHNMINHVSEKTQVEKITADEVVELKKPKNFFYAFSFIDNFFLYHTVHNPIQKETNHLCCFSEDVHHSYLLLLTSKLGMYTLYMYDLKCMEMQKAVRINVCSYGGFKQMNWVKGYDMLITLSNAGGYIILLKNEFLNNWSYFICDFELIDSNIEVIEDAEEFDIVQDFKPKYKNLKDSIWNYIIMFRNLFIKNKICIQPVLHPAATFPLLYTGYMKNNLKYFFYNSLFDFSDQQVKTAYLEEKHMKRKKNNYCGIKLENKIKKLNIFLESYKTVDLYIDDPTSPKKIAFHDDSANVELLTNNISYYLYYKNIINFSI